MAKQTQNKLPQAVQVALKALTPLEQAFVIAYCGAARGNGALAAKLAGVKGAYATQATRASVMRHDPAVNAAIEAWMNAHAISGTELTAQLIDLAQANPGPFVELQKNGTLKVKVLSEDAWQAHKHWIKGFDVDPRTGRVTKLHLHDAGLAKRELAKILKLYSDAPVYNFNMYLTQLSDDELLKEYQEAKVASGRLPAMSPN